MHRTQLLNLLKKYDPVELDEIRAKENIVCFINSYSNCFDRTNQKGHITASTWLLNKDKTKALLTHHAKLNSWFQLGGHCDGNPDTLAVCLKEAQEESGINEIQPVMDEIFDIDVHLIPANSKEPAHYHYDIRFLLRVTGDETLKISPESKALLWISKNAQELPTNERSVTRMFAKWLTWPLNPL